MWIQNRAALDSNKEIVKYNVAGEEKVPLGFIENFYQIKSSRK